MKSLEVSKILFYAISIASLFGLTFAFGLYSAARKTVVYEAVRALEHSVKESLILVFEETTTRTKTHPKHYLQPARFDGAGVTRNDVPGGKDAPAQCHETPYRLGVRYGDTTSCSSAPSSARRSSALSPDSSR